ncbi:MAG: ABC transporter permease [Erysipelotrichaceae bacterium]|nr:ABC transporter permease [Erysipelotrichaceae bacterium]
MNDNNNEKYDVEKKLDIEENEDYSLNDDRRVKVLSPGMMVTKRFFRNRVAVVGLTILVIMFLFSFVGGMLSPYSEKQFFYRYDMRLKEIAGAKENTEYRLTNFTDVSSKLKANAILNINKKVDEFKITGDDTNYKLVKDGEDFYSIYANDELVAFVTKAIVNLDNETADPELAYNIMKVYLAEKAEAEADAPAAEPNSDTFEYNGDTYRIDEEGEIDRNGNVIGYVSTYVVSPIGTTTGFTVEFKKTLQAFIEENDDAGNFVRDGENEKTIFTYHNDESKEDEEYVLAYNAADSRWVIKRLQEEYVYDLYSAPNSEHVLGTDGNGMDMLTRLMYGGRVSLVIGFIVVFLEIGLGVIMGGISGFFGGWVDFTIMRLCDVMFCIPSTPVLIIIGAAMDSLGVDPTIRMIYLMLILGFLGWPSIAHMVRGQILSLREQEFMTAAEATGLSTSRRIFKHLVPNVIPQLIVSGTMGLGSAILTEATLSYLGLGVRFPFASWGNIINGVNDTYVLTTYLWVWIPAGICILLTVLAFNLVGDGLRDAFDPKMKR